jgi:hypothetical protein
MRRGAVDNLLIVGGTRIKTILEEYIAFHNSQRLHQGIRQRIPTPSEAEATGDPIRKSAVLGGLHHYYHSLAARRMA